MSFATKDGGHKNSKFRAKRADKERESTPKMREPGQRAQANELEAKNPHEEEPMEHNESSAEEAGEELIHPDIHEEIKQVAAEHGPAHTMHTMHDHEAQKSHVHSVHMDGHEHHAQHDGPEHVTHALHHGMHASGVNPPEEAKAEGPMEHSMEHEPEEEYAL